MTPRQMGRKGGKTTGASKVRGDSAYYRALAAKRPLLTARADRNHALGLHSETPSPNCTACRMLDD